MSEAILHSLNSLGWDRVDPLLRRKVIDGSSMTMTRYSFSPGGRFPLHVHQQEQITYVLEGAIQFTFDEASHSLGGGDMVVIPPDLPHSAQAGPDGAEVLSVVSPSRTEGRGVQLLEE